MAAYNQWQIDTYFETLDALTKECYLKKLKLGQLIVSDDLY